MSTHAEALAQAEKLARISDNNLVTFFAQELRKIDGGENASNLLNSSIIRNLINLGMLEKTKRRGRRKRGLVLTDKARGLMENR